MYTILLADGTKLENLVLNGNNFISEQIIEDSVFEGNLYTVTISCDGEEHAYAEMRAGTYTDMKLMSNRVDGGKSWFILAEKSAQQKRDEAIMAAIEMLCMADKGV